jgi:hypothetical protein
VVLAAEQASTPVTIVAWYLFAFFGGTGRPNDALAISDTASATPPTNRIRLNMLVLLSSHTRNAVKWDLERGFRSFDKLCQTIFFAKPIFLGGISESATGGASRPLPFQVKSSLPGCLVSSMKLNS